LLRQYLKLRNIRDNFYLFASLIPSDGFITALNKAERITVANIYTEKIVLGSEGLSLMPIDSNMQDELIITTKAKRGESLAKAALKKAFLAIATEGTVTTRIRCHAKDIDKLDIIIDSLGKKKIQEITVELNSKDNVTLYQRLHILLTHSLFNEILLLLIVFFFLFVSGIRKSIIFENVILFILIYLTLNILLSILRGVTSIYFSFYGKRENITKDDKK
jgi:hypothetical protein